MGGSARNQKLIVDDIAMHNNPDIRGARDPVF
jgi:hypothetical protein